MKNLITLILFILFTINLMGQESGATINEQGKDITNLKHAWTAQWITHPTASTLDYNVFLFRRNFELKKKPTDFTIHVSADNRYRLFVNGKSVSTGPARGDMNHWRYETLDISKELKVGENVIAVEVVNYGEFRHAAQPTFQTALILQGPKDMEVDINTGKSDWKVTNNEAYDFIPFVSDSVGGYYAAGPGDKIDLSKYPHGWEQVNFIDDNWSKPRPGTVEFAVGRGFLFGSTWFLVPRTIPAMEEKVVRLNNTINSHSDLNADQLIKGNQALTIPSNSKVSILLDNKTHTIGYPELLIDKGKDSKVKITYAEALFYANSKERIAHKGWEKGNRNEFEGKEIRGVYDMIFPSGHAFKFKPLAMRTYRFLQLDIETKNEPLVLKDIYGVYTGYPFQEKASFNGNDAFLDTVWNTAWRTLRNSSTEIFIDPYYEQLQYVGDARVESMVSIYVSGDDKLMRKAIQSFDASRMPNGLTMSRFPSYIVQIIPTYSLFWVDMIHDYYMYRDDNQFIEQFLPGIETVLGWFDNKIDKTGMLGPLEWWNFTDWTEGFQNGIPPGADDGHSANVSVQYVYALKNASELFEHFGHEEKAKFYRDKAIDIMKSVRSNCYDSQVGLIAETPKKEVFSQHTNIMTILSGSYTEGEGKQLMKKVLEDKSLIQSSVYFKYYLIAALEKVGMADAYLNMLDPWKNMLDMGLTTFGETDNAPRSDCHAWSASPCFNFLHTVAGIRPLKPNFAEVLIAPSPAHLKVIEAEFPHPKGMISMKIKKKGEKWKGVIYLPENLKGKFILGNQKVHLIAGKNIIK